MLRRLTPALVVLLSGSVAVLGCGGASDTDFGNGDGSSDTGGRGGSSRGGSDQGGSTQGGSTQGGSTQGGSIQGGSTQGGSAQGGSAQGGSSSGSGGGGQGGGGSTQGGSTATGGVSGTATGGGTTGGSGGGGVGGADPVGGSGGAMGGTGAAGSGGVGGRGGGGGRGGNDCATIISNAQAALLAAQVCDPRLSVQKCTGKVEDLCGCVVPVNDPDSPETKSYLAQRDAAVRCGVACPAIVCREPTSTATCGISGATTNIVVARSYCAWPPR